MVQNVYNVVALRKITYLMLKYFSWGSRDSSGLRA
jgi:hypothetical protein